MVSWVLQGVILSILPGVYTHYQVWPPNTSQANVIWLWVKLLQSLLWDREIHLPAIGDNCPSSVSSVDKLTYPECWPLIHVHRQLLVCFYKMPFDLYSYFLIYWRETNDFLTLKCGKGGWGDSTEVRTFACTVDLGSIHIIQYGFLSPAMNDS